MEAQDKAVKIFVQLYGQGDIGSDDLNDAIEIVLLEPSREQAVEGARVKMFSRERLGGQIEDLPDAVGYLAKVLRDDGVGPVKGAIMRIRRVTNTTAPRVERLFLDAFYLAELFRTKIIKADDVRQAIKIALEASDRGEAESSAADYLIYLRNERILVGETGFAEAVGSLQEVFDKEGPEVFNKLTNHIWRLVNVEYQERRIPEIGETFYQPSFREWTILVSDIPSKVAWAWVLYSAPSAEISGYKGITAVEGNKSGYGWLDSLAVVVGLRGSVVIALCRQDDVFYVLQRDFS